LGVWRIKSQRGFKCQPVLSQANPGKKGWRVQKGVWGKRNRDTLQGREFRIDNLKIPGEKKKNIRGEVLCCGGKGRGWVGMPLSDVWPRKGRM